MKVIVNEFISLDGVVQAPGGPEEDTDGGFAHGGWSHPYFDPEVMGARFFEDLQRTDALQLARAGAFGCWEPDRRRAAWVAMRSVGDTLPLAPAPRACRCATPLRRRTLPQ